jgi:site-specific recombinase XerD
MTPRSFPQLVGPQVDEPQVDLDGPPAGLVVAGTAPAGVHPLAAMWAVDPQIAAENLRRLWYRLRDAWLDAAEMKSQSKHTRRAYMKASNLWLDFLGDRGVQPWEATTTDVRAWQVHLANCGVSDSTTNARLSAVSSWYSFIINEVHMVDGVERSAFFDAQGRTRANPFRVGNLRRAKVRQYGRARPLSATALGKLFGYLQGHAETVTGARNLALLLTYFLTASRNREVLQMKWGDIRPSRSQPGAYVFAWRGKGGKAEDTALPGRAYHAIVAYLKLAGRWVPGHEAHIGDDEFIFPPLVTHGLGNLSSAGHGRKPRGYMSEKNAVRILQTSLKLAGVADWDKYRIHDLRHSFAHQFQGDLEKLRRILHHESLATTGIYVRSLQDPVDDYSEGVWQKLGLGL